MLWIIITGLLSFIAGGALVYWLIWMEVIDGPGHGDDDFLDTEPPACCMEDRADLS